MLIISIILTIISNQHKHGYLDLAIWILELLAICYMYTRDRGGPKRLANHVLDSPCRLCKTPLLETGSDVGGCKDLVDGSLIRASTCPRNCCH